MTKDPYQNTASLYDRFVEPVNVQVRQIAQGMYPPQPGMHVLDVGCGTGTNLELYHRHQCHVAGIDISPAMIHEAKKKLGYEADIRLGDASSMPYADDSFDLVVSMLTLHEMPKSVRVRVMDEMSRVLNPSGRLLLIDFHPGPMRFPKGWVTKFLILLFEMAAGREHYRNYRSFLKGGGLRGLLQGSRLMVEKKKIVSGGNLGMFLLKPESTLMEYQIQNLQFSMNEYQTLRLP